MAVSISAWSRIPKTVENALSIVGVSEIPENTSFSRETDTGLVRWKETNASRASGTVTFLNVLRRRAAAATNGADQVAVSQSTEMKVEVRRMYGGDPIVGLCVAREG